MFYHIRIDYFDPKLKANQTLYSTDITDFNTISDKVSTYMRGENFLFAGTKLKNEDISHFRVFKSDFDIEKCKQIGDSRISPNIIWVYTTETILGEKNLCPEITEEVFSEVETKLSLVASSKTKPTGNPIESVSSRNVFIVHGHNKAIRTETELLIKKLGYNPIVLFKQPDGGATIIEKLERETIDIAFAIILYTYCDDGKSKEEELLKHRARQNVVFEHGMMCGLLGRKKVLALLESGVEMPGDLSGIIYKTIDEAGHWQIEVAREMKAAGLDIDLNRLF
ncbi:MAG: nucleotide-binding protein [Muribaculaceae bacterium]|nr:nucleotide-binding protein [Muribaculaceae bacterium]